VGCASQGDGCRSVPLNAAESPGGENLRGGKRLRLRFWKSALETHTYPLALNRPLIASLQLCSHFVFSSPLGVRPLPLDSPVPSLVLSLVVEPLLLLVGLLALVGEPPPSVWPFGPASFLDSVPYADPRASLRLLSRHQ
jgi:hypothetical protein